MLKGLLTGSFFGLLIGGVGVTVASLAGQQPAGNTPPAPPLVDAPQGADGPEPVVADVPAPTVLAEDGTGTGQAPLAVAPLAEPSAPIADTTPLALPQTAAVEGALQPPVVVALPDLGGDGEAPVLPNPQSVAPQIPQSEADIEISTVSIPPIPVETPPVVVVEDTAAPIDAGGAALAGDATERAQVDPVQDPQAPAIAPVPSADVVAGQTVDGADVQTTQSGVVAKVVADLAGADVVTSDPVTLRPADASDAETSGAISPTVDVLTADQSVESSDPVAASPVVSAEVAEVIVGTAEDRVGDPDAVPVQIDTDILLDTDVAATTPAPVSADTIVGVEPDLDPAPQAETTLAAAESGLDVAQTSPVVDPTVAEPTPIDAGTVAEAEQGVPVTQSAPEVEPITPVAEADQIDSTETAPTPDPTVAVPPQPEAVTGAEPEAIAGAEPEAVTSAEPEAVTGAEPDAVASAEPETIAGSAPDAAQTAETDTTSPASAEPGPAPVIDPQTAAAPEAPRAPIVVSIIDGGSQRLPTGTSGVRVNRQLGNAATIAPEPEAPAPAPIDPDAPALDRYAAAFDNADGKPLMALVLLDGGDGPVAAQALADLPFPVTVALNPLLADATDRMQAYRSAGLEVVLRAALPDGAQPVDVEIAMAAALDVLPQTVALIDDGADSAPASSAISAQMIAALAEDGRGFVTAAGGLNSGLRSAQAQGVPAATVFRDLDADGQDARVIRRFVDQAAFRARQNSGVILVARVRPETLDALAQWGNANRAGQVAMAPVSAVLRAAAP